MTLTEKFETLTLEQREKFNALKNSAEFDAFLSETGLELTAEESAQVKEFFETGKLPLSDEELDNVAGGGFLTRIYEAVKSAIKSNPHTTVGPHNPLADLGGSDPASEILEDIEDVTYDLVPGGRVLDKYIHKAVESVLGDL